MNLDPDYERAMAALPEMAVDWAKDSPARLRVAYEEMRSAFRDDLPSDVAIECLSLPGPAGPLDARLFLPPNDTSGGGAILYFHGGSWMVGSPETHETLTALLARASGWPVLSLDYRLAPEAPFPAQREDGIAAVRHCLDHGLGAMALPVERLVLCGDSAGGAISFWVANALPAALRERLAGIAGLYGAYGLFDSPRLRRIGQPEEGLGHLALKRALASLGPLEELAFTPGFDLLDAATAEGPPVYLLASQIDPVADDSLLLAERLMALGRDVTCDWVADLPHGFLHFAGRVPAAATALDRLATWIDARVGEA